MLLLHVDLVLARILRHVRKLLLLLGWLLIHENFLVYALFLYSAI